MTPHTLPMEPLWKLSPHARFDGFHVPDITPTSPPYLEGQYF